MAKVFSITVDAPVNPQPIAHGLDTLIPIVQIHSLWGGGYNAAAQMSWVVLDSNTIEVQFGASFNLVGYPLQVTVMG